MSIALTPENALILSETGSLWTWGTKYMHYTPGAEPDALPVRNSEPLAFEDDEFGDESQEDCNFEDTPMKCVSASLHTTKKADCHHRTMAIVGIDGSLWTWGTNWCGQLGHGTQNQGTDHPFMKPYRRPTRVLHAIGGYDVGTAQFHVEQVSCGHQHMIVRIAQHRIQDTDKFSPGVWVSGSNSFGQLGVVVDGAPLPFTTGAIDSDYGLLQHVPKLEDDHIRHVIAYRYRSAAVCMDGRAYTWGMSESPWSLGHKPQPRELLLVPTFVCPAYDVNVFVDAAHLETQYGSQDGSPTLLDRTLSIAMGLRTIAFLNVRSDAQSMPAHGEEDSLVQDRALWCCGTSADHDADETRCSWSFTHEDFGWQQLHSITSGDSHLLVLTTDGSVWLLGSRQTPNAPTDHLDCPGLQWKPGVMPFESRHVPPFGSRRYWSDIRAGWRTPRKAVFGLGRNPKIVHIAAGGELSAVVTDDGTMYAWGNLTDDSISDEVCLPICLEPTHFEDECVGLWTRLSAERQLALWCTHRDERPRTPPMSTAVRIREYTMQAFAMFMHRRAPEPEPRAMGYGLQDLPPDLLHMITRRCSIPVRSGNACVCTDTRARTLCVGHPACTDA